MEQEDSDPVERLNCWNRETIVIYSLEDFKLLIQMLLTLGIELELESNNK